MNKNHRTGYLNPIDWKALGFNKNQTGPQLTTYYITDSLHNLTSTSRWVNSIDTQASSDKGDNIFLRAENFSLTSSDVKNLDEKSVKVKAKTKAWLGYLEKDKETITNPYVENSTATSALLSTNVTVNETQLEALRNAKELKPYPLDITYQEKDLKVVRRIWVFITDEETVIDEENDVVIYAKDYSLPFDEASIVKQDDILSKSEIIVYRYQVVTTEDELKPLADKNNLAGLSVAEEDIQRIQTAGQSSKVSDIKIRYQENGKITTIKIDVTVGADTSDVTIYFVNENNENIHEKVILLEQKVEETIDLSTFSEVTDAIQTILDSKDYVSLSTPNNEYEVSSQKNEVTYIFRGLLSFTEVPSRLTFERGTILPTTQVLEYNNPNADFLVGVRDLRKYSDNEGQEKSQRGNFKVSVALTSPFKKVDNGTLLSGAMLSYNDEVISPSSIVLINSNADKEDAKKSDFDFILDKAKEKGKSKVGWSLTVPPKKVTTGDYEAELTWLLENTP